MSKRNVATTIFITTQSSDRPRKSTYEFFPDKRPNGTYTKCCFIEFSSSLCSRVLRALVQDYVSEQKSSRRARHWRSIAHLCWFEANVKQEAVFGTDGRSTDFGHTEQYFLQPPTHARRFHRRCCRWQCCCLV